MKKMATPIAPTPILRGEAAKQFEEYFNSPMTKEEKKLKKEFEIKETYQCFKID